MQFSAQVSILSRYLGIDTMITVRRENCDVNNSYDDVDLQIN